jgi:hypothetical protein
MEEAADVDHAIAQVLQPPVPVPGSRAHVRRDNDWSAPSTSSSPPPSPPPPLPPPTHFARAPQLQSYESISLPSHRFFCVVLDIEALSVVTLAPCLMAHL